MVRSSTARFVCVPVYAFGCARTPDRLCQDTGLPNRDALNTLMQRYFAALNARNAQNMRLKKISYRELFVQRERPAG